MNTSTIQESSTLSRRDFVNLASKESATVVTGTSGEATSNLTPMRNSQKSYEDAGTLAAKQAAGASGTPNIEEYRTHTTSLPKLSIIALTRCGFGSTPEEIDEFENLQIVKSLQSVSEKWRQHSCHHLSRPSRRVDSPSQRTTIFLSKSFSF